MTAWVHKECDIMDEDALLRLQGAWETPQQKDECSVRVDGSCKDGTMGSGCCIFQGEEADKCARVGREEEGKSSNRPEFGEVVVTLQSAALSEEVLLLCENAAVL
jgi:hypothetical protein